MPRLPIQIDLVDYELLADAADAKGTSPREEIQATWRLGLAARAQQPRENLDQLVAARGLAAA